MTTILYPFRNLRPPVTQSFDEHVQRARKNGWCPGPGNCPGGTYYYGGIDYGIATGTPVYAGFDGTVDARTQKDGYGNHVRVKNQSGEMLVYGHLRDYAVKTGDEVRAGDLLGFTDNTGFSSGPHLHFEYRDKNGRPQNPEPFYVYDFDDEPEPEPEPEPVNDIVIPPVPIPVQVKVISDYVNIRQSPSASAPWKGQYKNGKVLDIMRVWTNGREIWVKVGDESWVCMRTGGDDVYLEFLK